MNVLRGVFLAGSHSPWLSRRAMRHRFVRRAVSRFMPGETLDDALRAARTLGDQGCATILTHLGENVTDRDEAATVARHYLEVAERIRGAGLDAEISVKLTQLGLDLGRDLAVDHLRRIAQAARGLPGRVWVDMESSSYTDATLDVFRCVRKTEANVGVCLQAYLRRTGDDLESLLPLGPPIRLVKGAYDEPPAVAFRRTREVDESFMALADRLLSEDARRAGAWLAAGTHDPAMIRSLKERAASRGLPRDAFEFAMLYGIRRAEQLRLAHEGHRIRVLVSYGAHWFPWYMRRLAERPANVLFVVRGMLGS